MSSVSPLVVFTVVVGLLSIYLLKQLNLSKNIEVKESGVKNVKSLPSVFILFLSVISKMFVGKKKNLTLVPLRYELNDQVIDRKHVSDYCKVCGFPAPGNGSKEEVPLTYPQLLGFRMQLLLFLDKAFPFPAMGLVHMTNSVKQYQKLFIGMKVNVVVRCEEKLVTHQKGFCFDVICDIYSSSSADSKPTLLWSSSSTYLTRKTHKSADIAITYESLMKESDTVDLVDILEPWKLKGDLGRKYASVSEDYNPIHITAITASLFGFSKGCIAHGLWTSSKAIGVLTSTSPALLSTDSLAQSSSYLEYYVEYKTPIFLPNSVVLTGKQEAASGSQGRYILQVVSAKDKTKPHMKGYLMRKSLK
jgi:acyl dehydratase